LVKFQKGEKGENKKMEKNLSEFSVGERGVVLVVKGEGAVRRRLFDMGVTPGAEIYLRKKAPFGDPLEVNLRGYELTLRKAEAACVQMEVKI
jgi:Fe2+ transport system protein FeoA